MLSCPHTAPLQCSHQEMSYRSLYLWDSPMLTWFQPCRGQNKWEVRVVWVSTLPSPPFWSWVCARALSCLAAGVGCCVISYTQGYSSGGSLAFIFGGFFPCIYWMEERAWMLGRVADPPDVRRVFLDMERCSLYIGKWTCSQQNSIVHFLK